MPQSPDTLYRGYMIETVCSRRFVIGTDGISFLQKYLVHFNGTFARAYQSFSILSRSNKMVMLSLNSEKKTTLNLAEGWDI